MRITSCLNRAVQTRARHPATLFGDRTRTWSEVYDRIRKFAGALDAQGVRAGDHVAILALNNDNYIEAFFAIAWVGAVSVPLNTRWSMSETIDALTDSGAATLLFDRPFSDQVDQLRESTNVSKAIFIGHGEIPSNALSYEQLVATHPPIEDRSGSGDDLCSLCYTGGTTGSAKGVMLSHTNLFVASLNWIATLQFSDEIVFMHSAGLFHLAGSIPMFALTMAGGTHVCLPKFDAQIGMDAIQRHKVNYCLFVPTMINTILHHPDVDSYDLSSLRYIEYGASSMPENVLSSALKRLPDCEFIQGYGLTECTALALATPWRYHFDRPDWNSKRALTGRASYGLDVKITAIGGGAELPRGQHGEITIRGPQVMLGYWNQPNKTAETFNNGWLMTGDGGYMDEDGFICLTDRIKDMIISGGENVYSREVENAVFKHPNVKDCAVIGVPSPEWGEAVHAVVVLKEGTTLTLDELCTHCKAHIAPYKCPRSMELWDRLPLSAAGKTLKSELRTAAS